MPGRNLIVKRCLDCVMALICLVIGMPIFLVCSFVIFISMGRPILFKQQRSGYKGHAFFIYKFRTMSNVVGPDGELLPDQQRLTPLGSILRKWSLDELPECWNILKGEMSFVGPRPLLMEYLPKYSSEQNRRHEVLPGLTGWAQVNGRNLLSWEDKFKYDVWYVDHWNLWLDVKIIGMTIGMILTRKGINQQGFATVEKFNGNTSFKS